MEEHIRLRLEYKKLMRDGKKDKAMSVLKKIWAHSGKKIKPSENPTVKTVYKKESKKKVSKFTTLSDLETINGLGEKSLLDIKKQFNTIDELRKGLASDRVALRDDIVEKLKEELIE